MRLFEEKYELISTLVGVIHIYNENYKNLMIKFLENIFFLF